MKSLILSTALALIGSSTALHASHGQNFLLLEDYDIPVPGHGQVVGTFDWERHDGVDSYSTEPSLLFGVIPNAALSLSPRFGDEAGEGWDYASITPRLHLRLPESKLPFRMGLSLGYQFAEGHSEAGESEADGHGGGHENEHGGHHKAVEADSSESGGGIDDHDNSLWHTRLLVEADLTASTKAVFNIIGVFPERGTAAWGYGVGVRQQIINSLAVGVEARGDFESHGQHELLIGSYWSPVHDFTLRIGCGFGLTEETPDFVLRTGVIVRF